MTSDTRMRKTKQREAVRDCMQGFRDKHFTADELLHALRVNGYTVGRATVYRALAAFEGEGVVKRYCLHDDTSTCYQYIGPDSGCIEHYHMRCDACGALLHFQHDALDQLLSAIAADTGFHIDGRRTVFYGVCAECEARVPGILTDEGAPS